MRFRPSTARWPHTPIIAAQRAAGRLNPYLEHLSAYLGIAEASSRQGADRLCRFRCARGEACEAAAALEGVLVLNLAPEAEILTLLALLDRL